MKFNTNETANWLKNHDHFLILTHRRPDGDTLGTAAGLCALLRKIGKTAYLLENLETTPRYLGYAAPYWAEDNYAFSHIITVDMADTTLLPENAKQFADKVDLCIDHHGSNTNYAAHTYLMDTAAACGELIFHLASALEVTLDASIATPLYVALTTDTGCFQYANTTAETLGIAAKLVSAGASHLAVNKALFRTKSRARIALDGALFSGLQFFLDGTVAVCLITMALLEECGTVEDDLDDIATIPNMVEGVTIGVVIREVEGNFVKVSLRTAPNTINASTVCRKFDGGGHTMAAGCIIAASPDVALEQLISAITDEVEASK